MLPNPLFYVFGYYLFITQSLMLFYRRWQGRPEIRHSEGDHFRVE